MFIFSLWTQYNTQTVFDWLRQQKSLDPCEPTRWLHLPSRLGESQVATISLKGLEFYQSSWRRCESVEFFHHGRWRGWGVERKGKKSCFFQVSWEVDGSQYLRNLEDMQNPMVFCHMNFLQKPYPKQIWPIGISIVVQDSLFDWI